MRVGVIDYGVGNLGSVMRALEELSVRPVLLTRAVDLPTVNSLILPGVGNFADCAKLLNDSGWVEPLRQEVLVASKPLLGICLGMQLLATTSMEGIADNASNGVVGLNFIPGRVENLRTLGCNLRIPPVGWNAVTRRTKVGGLFDGIPDGTDFYFVHSYAFIPENQEHLTAITSYDCDVAAVIRNGNVFGCQFHPEKSSKAGRQLLKNFMNYSPC